MDKKNELKLQWMNEWMDEKLNKEGNNDDEFKQPE